MPLHSEGAIDIERARLISRMRNSEESFQAFFCQCVSKFDYDSFDPVLIDLFAELVQKPDVRVIEHLFRDQPRVPFDRGDSELRDLFLLP